MSYWRSSSRSGRSANSLIRQVTVIGPLSVQYETRSFTVLITPLYPGWRKQANKLCPPELYSSASFLLR